MYIKPDDHWIDNIMVKIKRNDLAAMFADIAEFRKTGVLAEESPVRDLAKRFEDVCPSTDYDLRITEDAILYELARRFNNIPYAKRIECPAIAFRCKYNEKTKQYRMPLREPVTLIPGVEAAPVEHVIATEAGIEVIPLEKEAEVFDDDGDLRWPDHQYFRAVEPVDGYYLLFDLDDKEEE